MAILYKNNESKLKEKRELLEKINISNKKRKAKRESEEPYKIEIKKNPNVKWLIVLMLICSLTGFLTPTGTTAYTYLYKTMIGNTVKNINEHLPLTLSENTPDMCAIILLLSLITFTKIKIRLSDLFMIGGLTYLMFMSKRQVTMLALVGSIIVNRMSVQAIKIYEFDNIKKSSKKLFYCTFMVLATVGIIFISKDYIENKKDDEFVNEKTYPVQAADWILNNLDVQNIKLFNEYNYGSYLLYKGIPVFIDSRADLYAPEFNGLSDDIFMDFINTSNISKYYGKTFKNYGITHVLVYKNSKIKMLIDNADKEKYKKIYSDDHFVIYEVK
jgi:hypothetical protein